ncbi:hypothetical protein DFJ58DRAFT_505409 [Suillus subalutaceus]|uniref:uncharacterized protein n=1 Tax=Suillus subalutaceus TaxID=48586 RepID=UPI001B8804C2|nr:uncharacterized protein DFJ58DRAFT_505409 [Suillus subalutaceus]KAG1845689.1 hypothetical protein DFJ58DRAFT_505409 [Suillus subalutaceus]
METFVSSLRLISLPALATLILFLCQSGSLQVPVIPLSLYFLPPHKPVFNTSSDLLFLRSSNGNFSSLPAGPPSRQNVASVMSLTD